MKQFITFTVKQYGQDATVSAHYSKIYKMNGTFFWEGFAITTHAAELQKDIEHQITQSEKNYTHQV